MPLIPPACRRWSTGSAVSARTYQDRCIDYPTNAPSISHKRTITPSIGVLRLQARSNGGASMTASAGRKLSSTAATTISRAARPAIHNALSATSGHPPNPPEIPSQLPLRARSIAVRQRDRRLIVELIARLLPLHADLLLSSVTVPARPIGNAPLLRRAPRVSAVDIEQSVLRTRAVAHNPSRVTVHAILWNRASRCSPCVPPATCHAWRSKLPRSRELPAPGYASKTDARCASRRRRLAAAGLVAESVSLR